MKLTVIGYWGGYPGKGEATSGYLLQHNGFNLLIDCGSGVLSGLQSYIQPEELDAVILSHYHHDHVADIGVLQYARLVQSFLQSGVETLPIYGHNEDQQGFANLTYREATKGVAYFPEESLTVGPFSIAFQKTKHPAVCYGMRITAGDQTIVYTADSAYLLEFIPFSTGADLLISECNFYSDQDGSGPGHMNSHDAGNLAEASGVPFLLLTHLPHFGDRKQLVSQAGEKYAGRIEAAYAGWTWGN
ncbi:MBL fold metallo-hydrolase [Fictibacillus enclensis]|uniref:MBL fold metallo-hydrolase n=1 Tax=Fictibacillus enclensis TaxID=1017270 RepID=UPI0024C018CE|nr:MBL fold metallo-hydrolase [Fictibacillus enclensis]WHY73301.1 MBL fold metallo-hydrolase [Fictibacillus enclensis]